MPPDQRRGLLGATDPESVLVVNPDGGSPYLLTCEHAGNRIPALLGNLGLGKDDLTRHIAWDIGAEATAIGLAKRLDATLIVQRYSRLVIDCNRPLSAPDSIPVASDGTTILKNQNLSERQRRARAEEIFLPFQQAISDALDRRADANTPATLIALHTFTPRLAVDPDARPWDLGLLYHRDNRLALLIDEILGKMEHSRSFVHNEPYSICDLSDHTIPFHGERRNIKHVLLEIRNDRVSSEGDQLEWANFLGSVLKDAEPSLTRS